jgi:hypothetical protein
MLKPTYNLAESSTATIREGPPRELLNKETETSYTIDLVI